MRKKWKGLAHNKLKLYLVAWWSVPNHINIKIKPNMPRINKVKEDQILKSENIVKVVTEKKLKNNNFVKALNFSRKYNLKEKKKIFIII